ncbi:MAG: hypothetical protein N2322_07450, partial [Terrimicrobiaceae bacterium]|nr:hypothetical protein [Terrimicrobiaceae bacterium]
VQRAGAEFGVFDPEEFERLRAEGAFFPTDLCREEGEEGWTAFETFARRRTVHAYGAAQPSGEAPRAWSTGRGSRRPSPAGPLAALMILLLLAGAAIGSWGVLQHLDAREWKARAAQLKAELETLRAAPPAAPQEPDLAPMGTIRGRVILKSAQGRRIAISGVKLRLFPRAELERHLAEIVPQAAAPGTADPLAALLASLPAAIEVTATDASGVFEFHPPEPGEYVVQTSIVESPTGKLRAWFLAVDTRDHLNTPLFLTEANAVAVINPLLILNEAR